LVVAGKTTAAQDHMDEFEQNIAVAKIEEIRLEGSRRKRRLRMMLRLRTTAIASCPGRRTRPCGVWDVPELVFHDFARDTVALALISKVDRLSDLDAIGVALWVMFGEPLTRMEEWVRDVGGKIVDGPILELVLARTTAFVTLQSTK